MSLLDLRGVQCPMTFIKTKLALEELQDGQVLTILIDDKLASVDVPGSASLEGHEVLQTKEIASGVWEVVIRKRGRRVNSS